MVGARWGDQAGFVGEHDGLDADAQAELGQDPADVNLHWALGQEQAGRVFMAAYARRHRPKRRHRLPPASGVRSRDLGMAMANGGAWP